MEAKQSFQHIVLEQLGIHGEGEEEPQSESYILYKSNSKWIQIKCKTIKRLEKQEKNLGLGKGFLDLTEKQD